MQESPSGLYTANRFAMRGFHQVTNLYKTTITYIITMTFSYRTHWQIMLANTLVGFQSIDSHQIATYNGSNHVQGCLVSLYNKLPNLIKFGFDGAITIRSHQNLHKSFGPIF
jgi:hypothetical protein